MKTPTGCCASTSPKAPTSPSTHPPTSPPSPPNSTAAPAKPSAGTPPPNASLNSSARPAKQPRCNDPWNPPTFVPYERPARGPQARSSAHVEPCLCVGGQPLSEHGARP